MSDMQAAASETESEHEDIVEFAHVSEEPEDDEDTNDRLIGEVGIPEDGRLEVVEADPSRATFLHQAVHRVNGKSQITLAMQEAPIEPFATPIVSASRDNPNFTDMLRIYPRTYYGLRLD